MNANANWLRFDFDISPQPTASKTISKPQVLFLITGLDGGGAERQVVDLAIALAARGWQPAVVSLLAGGRLRDELITQQVPCTSLKMARGIVDPRAVFRLSTIVRQFRPDIVHAHMLHASLLAAVTRPFSPMRGLIATVHTMDPGNRCRRMGYRISYAACDRMTMVSEVIKTEFLAGRIVSPERVCVMRNGICPKRFQRDCSARARLRAELALGDEFVWLAVGRLEPVKDYPTLLHAFGTARMAQPLSKLLIAGSGALEQELKQLSAALGLSESVRFLGYRQDTASLMSAADSFVLSSRWEGMPLVILEAGAAELPVVATAVGGSQEIVPEGETGFLVPPADPVTLAKTMVRVMKTDLQSRCEIGRRARAHVAAHYDLQSVVTSWERLYQQVLTPPPQG